MFSDRQQLPKFLLHEGGHCWVSVAWIHANQFILPIAHRGDLTLRTPHKHSQHNKPACPGSGFHFVLSGSSLRLPFLSNQCTGDENCSEWPNRYPKECRQFCRGLESYDCLGINGQFLGKLLARTNDKEDLVSANVCRILSKRLSAHLAGSLNISPELVPAALVISESFCESRYERRY